MGGGEDYGSWDQLDESGDQGNAWESLSCLQPPLFLLVLLRSVRNLPPLQHSPPAVIFILLWLLPKIMGPADHELRPLKWWAKRSFQNHVLKIMDPTLCSCLFCSLCIVSEKLGGHLGGTLVFWGSSSQLSPEDTSLVLWFWGWEAHTGQSLSDMVVHDTFSQTQSLGWDSSEVCRIRSPTVPLGRLCLSNLQRLLDNTLSVGLITSLAWFSIPRFPRILSQTDFMFSTPHMWVCLWETSQHTQSSISSLSGLI